MESNGGDTGFHVARFDELDVAGPESMAAVLAKRPGMYVGVIRPSTDQWRLILDSMSLAAGLAGVEAGWSPEDREAMQRDDLGQDEDALVGLLTKVIAALREAPGEE